MDWKDAHIFAVFCWFYWPEITAGDSHLENCSFQETSYFNGKAHQKGEGRFFFLLSAVKSGWVSSLRRLWLRQPPVAPLWRAHGARLFRILPNQKFHQIQNTPQPQNPLSSENSQIQNTPQFRILPNSEYSPIQNTPQPKNPPNFSGLSKLRHGFSCFYWPEITAGDSHLEICSFQQTSYLSGKLFYGLLLCSVPWFWITLKDQNCHLNISFTRQLPKT